MHSNPLSRENEMSLIVTRI